MLRGYIYPFQGVNSDSCHVGALQAKVRRLDSQSDDTAGAMGYVLRAGPNQHLPKGKVPLEGPVHPGQHRPDATHSGGREEYRSS